MIIVLTAALLSGCGLLDTDDASDDETGNDDDDESSDTNEPPPPPSEGFRVYPKFMLQTVPAIVTIEAGDGVGGPMACVLDGAAEGGYVCDASALIGDVVIRVDKDGFESALRSAEILLNQIQALDVHLSADGGPTGVWSACVSAGEFDSCAVVCEGEMLACAVTSCATEQAQWPIATLEVFAGSECVDSVEVVASGCDDLLPGSADVASLRCCCAG